MMRWLFMLSFVGCLLAGQGQEIKVHLHTHSWAAGVCCAHGVDYTYTIKIPQGDWSRFDSLQVCTQGMPGRYARKQLKPTVVGDTLVFTVNYSYRADDRFDRIDPEVIKYKPCTEEGLVLIKDNMRKSVAITRRTDSITAYP